MTWRNTGSLAYPVGRLFGLGIEGMLGPQFEEGLAGVKSLAESIEEPPPPAPEKTPAETRTTSS